MIHVLLTRTPLYSPDCSGFLVRLACVRRAASVDSEPGSNSHLKHMRMAGASPDLIRSAFTQSSLTNFLYCIQPDCQRSAQPEPASIIPELAAGLETVIDGSTKADATEEIENSKRAKQEGRIPLPRWPGKALLPFLTEVSLFIPLSAQQLQTTAC